MSRIIIAALFFLFGLNQVKSQNLEQIVIGTKHILHSNILNEEREYWINLPESYNNSEESYKKYPVLIVLDANTHFKSITGMVSHMSRNGKIPEMIIVAVQNVDRRRDFTRRPSSGIYDRMVLTRLPRGCGLHNPVRRVDRPAQGSVLHPNSKDSRPLHPHCRPGLDGYSNAFGTAVPWWQFIFPIPANDHCQGVVDDTPTSWQL